MLRGGPRARERHTLSDPPGSPRARRQTPAPRGRPPRGRGTVSVLPPRPPPGDGRALRYRLPGPRRRRRPSRSGRARAQRYPAHWPGARAGLPDPPASAPSRATGLFRLRGPAAPGEGGAEPRRMQWLKDRGGGGPAEGGAVSPKGAGPPRDPPTRVPPVSPTDARILDLPGGDIFRAWSGRDSFGLSPHSGATQPRARGGGRAGVGAGLAAGGPWAGAPARTAGAAGARAPSCGRRRRLRGGAAATGQCGGARSGPAAALQARDAAGGSGLRRGAGGRRSGAGSYLEWCAGLRASGGGEAMGGIVEGGVRISGLGGAFLSVPVWSVPATSHRVPVSPVSKFRTHNFASFRSFCSSLSGLVGSV